MVDGKVYVLIDEIELVPEIVNPYTNKERDRVSFANILISLSMRENTEIYATGSNSMMMSREVATQIRGRVEEIRVYPLSLKEVAEEAYANDL